ncbi:MAG: hypothetical protein MJ059_04105 [Lachnospiraceae bacterium]|nr:hypothetical protein [Lachnospiraceae bacterium]
MGALFLTVCVLDGLVLACVQNKISKDSIRTMSDNAVYEALVFGIGAVVMGAFGGVRVCSPYTVHLGVVLGILIILEGVFAVNALRIGSMSLSTMISMCSLVIPIIPAKWLWGEELTWQRITGIVLMIISMGLILNLITEFTEKKKNAELEKVEYGVSRKWAFFAFMSFLAGGVMGFNQKKLTTCGLSGEIMPYLFYGFVTASLLGAVLYFYYKNREGEGLTLQLNRKNMVYIIPSGIAMALLHIATMKAIELLPMSLLLPISNGGRLILVTVIDMWLFKQKLSVEQLIGITVGITSIVLLSL